MSYLERTAKKLLPILEEVKKRMIKEKRRFLKSGLGNKSGGDNKIKANAHNINTSISGKNNVNTSNISKNKNK